MPTKLGLAAKNTYEWLIKNGAFSGIISSVLFPLILVPLLAWFINRVQSLKDQDAETVCISVPAELGDYEFKLRYVRDGMIGWRPGTPLYKEDYPFIGGANNKCVTIAFPRHYGVQFKPYVSLKGKPLSFDQVSELLQQKQTEFHDISKDCVPGQPYVWFLLWKYSMIEDKGNELPTVTANPACEGRPIFNNFFAR